MISDCFGFMHISFASINNPKLIYMILFTLCDVLGWIFGCLLLMDVLNMNLKSMKIILFVFSSVLLGGWPSNWDDGDVLLRKSDEKNNK